MPRSATPAPSDTAATPPAPLILASASPRRREALAALGVPFEIVVSSAEEHLPPPEDPTDPAPIAAAKAADVAAVYPDRIVLAGDTIVVVEHDALGKPGTPERARAMLERLRGREHAVRTAVALARGGQVRTAAVACPLSMRAYSDEALARYVASGEPLDCAGAYDVHRLGGALVERVEGCFSTVVGLPIAQAARMLAAVGVQVPADPAAVCTQLYGRRCLASDAATAAACYAGSEKGTPSPGGSAE